MLPLPRPTPCLLALLVALPLPACGGDSEAPPPGPDVFLIVVDTLRADHLGCYGYPRPTSPAIDQLAEQGQLFEYVVASAPMTGPAVASILTGKGPRQSSFGYNNGPWLLDPSERTIAEEFREHGYRTAAFVCNPVTHERYGFNQGFERYDQEMPGRERIRGTPERSAEAATDAAIAWLDEVGEQQRVFAWLHFMDPHGPYLPPEEFADRFHSADRGEELFLSPKQDDQAGQGTIPAYQAWRDRHFLNEYVDLYDGEIAYLDHHLARLFDALRARGRYEDAVILLTSDHGEALGEHGYYFAHGHGVTRDQSAVPLILKHPGVEAGTRCSTPVGHVDIFRTLTRLLGVEGDHSTIGLGADLADLDGDRPNGRALFCEFDYRLAVHLEDGEGIGLVYGQPYGSEARRFELTTDGLTPAREASEDELARRVMDAAEAYLAQPAAPVRRQAPPSDAQLQRLRSLGYTGEE